ncbi:Ppox [Symbiodinium natans]|uniref:Ppox protein n=1 Tax=Symbiodinium natans TaxID=878477 RepID=A0A812NVW0_9DINO|nr:Ppox [Symbiodinium natans]
MAEPLWPRSREPDESVAAFTSRRASRSLALRLADPICRGQLAGKAEDLSVRTCFPRLWHNEQRFGSVFVGAGGSETQSTDGNLHATCLIFRRSTWRTSPPRQRLERSSPIDSAAGWPSICWCAPLHHAAPQSTVFPRLSYQQLEAPRHSLSLQPAHGKSMPAPQPMAQSWSDAHGLEMHV